MKKKVFHQEGYIETINRKSGTVHCLYYYVKVDGDWKLKKKTVNVGCKCKRGETIPKEQRPPGWHRKDQICKAAEKELRDLIPANPNVAPAKEISFQQFYDRDFSRYMLDHVKDSTADTWKSIATNYLLPTFKDVSLSDINKASLKAFFNGNAVLLKKSNKTRNNVYGCMNRILNLAYEQGEIAENPLSANMHLRPKRIKTRKPVLSPLQIQATLNAIPTEYKALYTLMALTGLRLGETLGLKWQDVNWRKSRLSIVRSIYRGKEQPPKTEDSVRQLPLPRQAWDALQWHLQNISMFTKAEDYIFANGNGEPLGPDHLREAVLYPAYEKANGVLPEDQQIVRKPREYGFHICRHTAGSEMIEETGDLTKAQRQLGRASIDITADVYAHQVGNADEKASQQLADKLFPTLSLPESSNSVFITLVLPESTENGAVEELASV